MYKICCIPILMWFVFVHSTYVALYVQLIYHHACIMYVFILSHRALSLSLCRASYEYPYALHVIYLAAIFDIHTYSYLSFFRCLLQQESEVAFH